MNINDQKRLKRIKNKLYNLKLEKGMQVSIEEIKECLGNEDYEFVLNVLENKNDKKNNSDIVALAEKIISETPYTILNIEEKKYTKQELLKIVGERINSIGYSELTKEEKDTETDKVLDAYNEINKLKKL